MLDFDSRGREGREEQFEFEFEVFYMGEDGQVAMQERVTINAPDRDTAGELIGAEARKRLDEYGYDEYDTILIDMC